VLLIYIALTGILLFGLIAWFHTLEVRGDRHAIFLVFFFTLLVEAILAGPAADVPIGLLRPRVLGQDFRPPDAVIVAAIIVRLLHVRGRQFKPMGVAWGAFIAIYLTGVIVGVMNNVPWIDVLYQGKSVFYLLGAIVIASGVDVRRVYDSVGSLALVLAMLIPIAFVMETLDLAFSFSTPVQRFNRLGRLSNDTITLLTLVGVVTLLVEVTRPGRRAKVIIAGAVLLLAPLVGHQRASYLVLGAALVAFALLVLGRTWQRRATATVLELSLFGLGLVGLLIAGVALSESPGIVIAPVQDAFAGEAEQRTAQARVQMYNQAIDKIEDSPLIGSGVGTKVVRRAEKGTKDVEAAAHNILLDLGMRVGLFGVTAYLIALWSTTRNAVRVWRRARDDVSAAIAMAGLVVVLGTSAKALVEPAFDKFRLAIALGIGVGLVMAAQRVLDATGEAIDQDAAVAPQSERRRAVH
jgi:O-antigen ligase